MAQIERFRDGQLVSAPFHNLQKSEDQDNTESVVDTSFNHRGIHLRSCRQCCGPNTEQPSSNEWAEEPSQTNAGKECICKNILFTSHTESAEQYWSGQDNFKRKSRPRSGRVITHAITSGKPSLIDPRLRGFSGRSSRRHGWLRPGQADDARW